VKIGFIGTGLIAEVHLAGLRLVPDADVVAAMDIDAGRAEEIAHRYDIPRLFNSYEELVDCDDVEVVVVATPPLAHHDPVATALDARKPVICEKPLALNPGEAEDLHWRAISSGVVHATAFNRRYDPWFRYLRDLVGRGEVGEVRLASHTVAQDWFKLMPGNSDPDNALRGWTLSASSGGGFLRGGVPHYFDLFRYLFGNLEVKSSELEALAGRTPAQGDDHVIVSGVMDNGGVFNLTATRTANHGIGERMLVVGSERTVGIEADGTMWITEDTGRIRPLEVPDDYWSVSGRGHWAATTGIGQAALFIDFGQALSDRDATPAFATFEDGWRCAQIVDQVAAGSG
jgi:predicted dehydrogenase